MRILALTSRPRNLRGFTLIEVILSILILAVGIVSVQHVLIGSLSALNVIEHWSQAERLLEEKIWNLKNEIFEKGKKFQNRNSSEIILGSDLPFQYDMNLNKISADGYLMEAHAMISWGKMNWKRSIKRVFYLQVPYADWKD